MLIIPAVDMLGGHCVRLYKGDYDQSQTYSDDPYQTALNFQKEGARLIHLVDLDAARGQGDNRKVIRKICRELDAEVEIGGGIRSEKDVEELLEAGARRLILGTLLAREPEVAEAWVKKYPEADFIAGIDALDGEVKVSGWEKESGIQDADLAVAAAKMGFKGIIYTNIARDGTLTGPDIENTARIANACKIPVIVSGGVSSHEDLKAIADAGVEGFWGVITGKAVYEGHIDVAKAVSDFQNGLKGGTL